MDEPAALARRDRKENEETERKESRAVFRQACKAEKEPDCEPERDDRRFRLEQQSRQRPSRGCEREEERAVGHDPAARRGEKERRRIERKNRQEPGGRAEEIARQGENQPAGRGEKCDEGQAHGAVFAKGQSSEMRDPLMQRRMIEIGPTQAPRHRQRIGLVNAKIEREGEDDPRQGEAEDHRDRQGGLAVCARRLGRRLRGGVADGRIRARRMQQIPVPNQPSGAIPQARGCNGVTSARCQSAPSAARGHIGPPSSSRFAAPPLRSGRFAMTTARRRGLRASKVFATQSRLLGRLCVAKTMDSQRPERSGQGSRA